MPNIDPNFHMNQKHEAIMVAERMKQYEGAQDMKPNFEIVAANYGTDVEEARVNVVDKVRELQRGCALVMDKVNDAFGDVAPNQVKPLRIMIRYNDGEVRHLSYKENERVVIPNN